MIYRYLAIDAQGRSLQGIRFGRSTASIRKNFSRKNLTIVTLSAVKIYKKNWPQESIKLKTLSMFADQMHQLMQANLSVPQSIKIIQKTLSDDDQLHTYLEDVNRRLSEGYDLSEAFQPDINYWGPMLYISLQCMDRSLSMNPAEVWRMIAEWAHRIDEVRKSFLRALAYPAFISVFTFIIIGVLLVVVVPSFESLFHNLLEPNYELSFATSLLLKASALLKTHPYLIICLCLTAFLSLYCCTRTQYFKRLFSKLITLKLIQLIFGDARPARFFDSIHFLLESGLKLAQALERLQTVELFYGSKPLCQNALEYLKTGMPFSSWMKTIDFFHPTTISLIQSAEHSGSFRQVFTKISQHEHHKLQQRLKTCISLTEPFCILILTGIIGLFIFLLFQPLWTLIDQL